MPYHEWGDETFDFKLLYKAMDWTNRFYRRAQHKNTITKEKYGTVRYEFTYLWLMNKRDVLVFSEILRRACFKFPGVAAELVDDWYIILSPHTLTMMYYTAFFEGVVYGSSKSGWWPKQRPYKPFKKDDYAKYRKA